MTLLVGIQEFEKPICYDNNPLLLAQYILEDDIVCKWEVTNSSSNREVEFTIHDNKGKCKTNLILQSLNECLLVIATGDYTHAHCLDFIKLA